MADLSESQDNGNVAKFGCVLSGPESSAKASQQQWRTGVDGNTQGKVY